MAAQIVPSQIFLTLCKLDLTPNQKLKAYRDVFHMESSDRYAKKVKFKRNTSFFYNAFDWSASDLGQRFWNEINEKLLNL